MIQRSEVDEKIVEKVLKLCDWQLKVRKLHTPVDADNVVAELEEKIRIQLKNKGSMTSRELFQYTNAKRKGRHYFDWAVQNLKKGEEIQFNDNTKKYSIIP